MFCSRKTKSRTKVMIMYLSLTIPNRGMKDIYSYFRIRSLLLT